MIGSMAFGRNEQWVTFECTYRISEVRLYTSLGLLVLTYSKRLIGSITKLFSSSSQLTVSRSSYATGLSTSFMSGEFASFMTAAFRGYGCKHRSTTGLSPVPYTISCAYQWYVFTFTLVWPRNAYRWQRKSWRLKLKALTDDQADPRHLQDTWRGWV